MLRGQRAQRHLGRALGGAHHVGGVHRLVGADEHEALGARLRRRPRRSPGAQRVVAQRRPGIALLHQRHVLVGRGVEHHLRPPALHHAADLQRVLHVGHQAYQLQRRELLGQLLFDGVEVELAQLHQHQPRRPLARHLAAQLCTNAAARPGNEHRAPAQHARQTGFVQRHRVAAEQVFGFDVAHAGDLQTRAQFVGAGHRQHMQAGARRALQQLALGRAPQRGQRHHQVGGGVVQHGVIHAGQRAHDGHAGDAGALLGGVVIQQRHHRPPLLVDAGQQATRSLAGAQHEGAPGRALASTGDARARVLVQHAVAHAHQAHAHQRHHRVQRQHGARHLAQAQGHHRQGRQAPRGGTGQRQAANVTKPGKAPHALGHAGQGKGREVGHHDAQQHPGVVGRAGTEPAVKTQTEEVGDVPGQGDNRPIYQQ